MIGAPSARSPGGKPGGAAPRSGPPWRPLPLYPRHRTGRCPPGGQTLRPTGIHWRPRDAARRVLWRATQRLAIARSHSTDTRQVDADIEASLEEMTPSSARVHPDAPDTTSSPGQMKTRHLLRHIQRALARVIGELTSSGIGYSPRACVAAVLEMQQALETRAWPSGEQVQVRMGVHTGEASRAAAGLVGLDVHRAARVAAVGYGGQVLVSETAAALVRDRLPPGASLADLGVHRLKDLGRPERIFQLQAAGLQAGFPPLRSLGNPALANNLPAELARFIGRDRELAEVRALLGSSRLVTLTGAGGSGKTRLGLQAAAGLLDGSGDGVWLVELAAVTSEDAVAAAVCGALGIAAQPGRPALDILLDALAPQDMLIVLDNCEHLIGGCAKVADAIMTRCPRAHV